MAYNEDHIALAAEYALGTLDADERAQVQATISADANYAALVEAWELKLGALNQMVGLVEPSPQVWERIKAAIGMSGEQQAFALPTPAEAPKPAPTMAPPAPANDSGSGLSPESMRVVRFAKQTYVWKRVAASAGALAASLLLVLGVQLYKPDVLPDALRPPVRTQIVKVETPPPAIPAQYVAVLQQDGNSPAFILTVDAGSKSFTVRRVAATPEPGKSYELWLVSDKLQKPRSLGVIGGRDFTVNPSLASYDSDIVSKATYAVTIEPEGGSPTGVATGPIVYTGKLVESVPSVPMTPRR
ncbi:anti-sigma factor [Rhodopseudomonas pseudopalustris]|uniref:Anti-sigma-K factor RskA n=1 Tax=Rhodopseudomonas pseudopalustris TaxID=1513892 RepID=A0A1H8QYN0_9BRAD|nr:anti-sigma factor [Rhodopseudomonas pseudopalustris]SEO59419.1 Anti-sigma-K factor RskA [Rhodopseudomonas pseudopalustris]